MPYRLTDMTRTSRRAAAAALVLVVGALAGCGGGAPSGPGPAPVASSSGGTSAAGPPPGGPSVSGSPSTGVAGSPTSTAPGRTPLVSFTRAGGVAGLVETLTVVDGRARLRTRGLRDSQPSPLTPAESAALAGAVRRARIAEVATGSPRLKWEPGSRDTYSYRITVGTVTVRAADGVVPPALKELLRVLAGLADRVRATG